MNKDDVSVPLTDLNSSTPHYETKPDRSKKRSSNSLIFKIVFLILISVLIVLLITTLTIVILRYQSSSPNPPKNETTKVPQVQRIRIPNKVWNEYFLPPYITPIHYSLTLQLLNSTYNITSYNLTDTFYGKVCIYFQCHSKTHFVVLHVNYLTIQSISLKREYGSIDVKIIEIINDTFYNYMIVVLDKQLIVEQTYVFEIKYYGVMTTDRSGIITTIYTDVSAKQKYYILYSKLEPIGARRICPCFDEPDKKATYSVNLIHEDKFQALSNMPLNTSSKLNFNELLFSEQSWNKSISLTISYFNRTEIPMSIYLLAFVLVENYDHFDVNRKTDKTVRLWFPKDLSNSAQVSLNYSRVTEDFFERYFNYTSPLPKTDHVYIPDFLSGAMENWGLITYRDRHLLISPTNTAYQSKTSLMTIAHELAHFWFGNWLTIKTWGEIWLNEGFATHFASFAYYKLIGLDETKAEELFLYEKRQVLTKDTRSNFSAVIVNVTDPIMFKKVFNPLTYYKGQFLLVWLESIMGSNGFHNAIKAYIKKYAKQNPTNAEFFDVIDEVGPEKSALINIGKLKDFFYPWLYKGGFPIVTINYDINKSELILTQKSVLKNSSSTEKWPIHVTYKTGNLKSDKRLYFNDNKTFKENLNGNEFVIFNSNGKSYIRVNYSELLWDRIIGELKSADCRINQISKIVLYDDAFYFADSNNIDVKITKGLIESFEREINPIPWLIFYYKIFDRIYDLFKEDILFIKFSEFVVKLSDNIVAKTLQNLTHENLNLIEDIHQRAILTMSCDANNDKVLDWMLNQFRNWIKYPLTTNLPKHLVRLILFYGIKNYDNKKNWLKLWKMLTTKKNRGTLSDDQIAIGLAGTSKPYYLNKLLNYYLISGSHRSNNDKYQDFTTVVDWISKSTNGIIVLQRWILRNSADIMKYAFGDNLSLMDQGIQFEGLLLKICKSIYEPYLITPLLKLHKRSGVLTKIVENNEWRETVGKKIIKLFQK